MPLPSSPDHPQEPVDATASPPAAPRTLADIARAMADHRLPPVADWTPDHCGDSEMRIDREGQWFHQGSPIGRDALWILFSTLLRREPDGSHVLVTPVEKLSIQVEDAAFLAVELRSEGEHRQRRLAFRLNSGDWVMAGPDHRLRFAVPPGDGQAPGPRPYLAVRHGLEARLARPVYYELVALALEEAATGQNGFPVDHGDEVRADAPIGLWSDGAFFPIAAD